MLCGNYLESIYLTPGCCFLTLFATREFITPIFCTKSYAILSKEVVERVKTTMATSFVPFSGAAIISMLFSSYCQRGNVIAFPAVLVMSNDIFKTEFVLAATIFSAWILLVILTQTGDLKE